MGGIRRTGGARELNSPWGGTLVNLKVTSQRAEELKAQSRDLVSLDLSPRQLCDLEMLATGAFSPLQSFMGRSDYEAVCARMRLAEGRLWPIPVTLDVSAKFAEKISPGLTIALRDPEGMLMATLTVSEIWNPDKGAEAQCLYGTRSYNHAAVNHLLNATGDVYISGKLEVLDMPVHHDFGALRQSPAEVRERLARQGVTQLVGYHPRQLMHRAHVEFTKRTAYLQDAALLIQPAVGRRGINDADHFSRVRALGAALERFSSQKAQLNLMELSPRYCGARSALWHAILLRNYGCTHYVIEHDYADQGEDADGHPLYGQYQSLESVSWHAQEIGIEAVPFRNLVLEEDQPEKLLAPHGSRRTRGTARLPSEQSAEIAHWFSYPAVLEEWRKTQRHGFTLFFTGLSGAGKSTLAQMVYARLKEQEARPVTLLDGDIVRKHMSSELGFSREHRDLNVMRQGFVASLITRHGGIAICAPIAPYANTRAQVRAMIEEDGDFIEIFVATPLSVCETRDRKGLYARARAGLIKQFTGVTDPYETPLHPEIIVDTSLHSAIEGAEKILAYLTEHDHVVRNSKPEEKPAASRRDPATLWTSTGNMLTSIKGTQVASSVTAAPANPLKR